MKQQLPGPVRKGSRMRSARLLLATAAAAAVTVVTAPGALAAGSEWDTDPSSYSNSSGSSYSRDQGSSYNKEHGSSYSRDHHKDGSHDGPRGGIHTGGGALTAVTADDSSDRQGGQERDWGSKEREWGSGGDHEKESSWKKEGSWSSGHEKPRGGMHTGGGALSGPSVTAGGLAVLAVAGTGLYVVRRKKSAAAPA